MSVRLDGLGVPAHATSHHAAVGQRQVLLASASRGVEHRGALCRLVHDRRQRPEFYRCLVGTARRFPDMRRSLRIAVRRR